MGYYNRLPGTNQYDNGGTACGKTARGAAGFPERADAGKKQMGWGRASRRGRGPGRVGGVARRRGGCGCGVRVSRGGWQKCPGRCGLSGQDQPECGAGGFCRGHPGGQRHGQAGKQRLHGPVCRPAGFLAENGQGLSGAVQHRAGGRMSGGGRGQAASPGQQTAGGQRRRADHNHRMQGNFHTDASFSRTGAWGGEGPDTAGLPEKEGGVWPRPGGGRQQGRGKTPRAAARVRRRSAPGTEAGRNMRPPDLNAICRRPELAGTMYRRGGTPPRPL